MHLMSISSTSYKQLFNTQVLGLHSFWADINWQKILVKLTTNIRERIYCNILDVLSLSSHLNHKKKPQIKQVILSVQKEIFFDSFFYLSLPLSLPLPPSLSLSLSLFLSLSLSLTLSLLLAISYWAEKLFTTTLPLLKKVNVGSTV